MKKLIVVMVMLAVMVAGLAPAASALEGEEIAVTGVVTDQPDKADSTPLYGIKDEVTLKGYYLEGDYSTYVGQRVTVHGMLETYPERVLKVSWLK
jgi:hypothetical protein